MSVVVAPQVIVTDVRQFGASGGGVADDTLAIRGAITAAGVGGTVYFPPGLTFLLSGILAPLQGQTFWGYGAKLKRCNAVTTTTTGAISAAAGPTTIPVSSSASFRVGMDVAVWQSSSVYDTSTHRISAIPDSTHITVLSDFTQALNSGSTVTTAFSPIATAASDVRVLGLELDGNRANNTGIAKWYWHNEVYLISDRGVVRDCYIHDAVSEGVQIGGNGCTAQNNYLINCGGNGIHFSSSAGGKAIGNYVKSVNLAGSATDHADGCIIFSNTTGDSIIANNYCDTGISGVASIDSDDNSSVVISGNIIKNCTASAIEGTFPSTATGGKVTITGNLFYSSVKVDINYTSTFSTSYGPYNWIVANNYFYQTYLKLTSGFGMSVTGNQFDFTGDTSSTAIAPTDIQNAIIANNYVKGSQDGIFLDGSNTSGVKISGNVFTNQSFRAIYINAHSGKGVSVDSNTVVVESGYTAASGYIGIYAPASSTFVTGNTIAANGTFSGSSYGIRGGAGGVSTNGAIVTNNYIRSSGLTAAIFFAGSSQGNIAAYNFTQQAVTDSGSNTLTGNVTIN